MPTEIKGNLNLKIHTDI